MAITSARMQMRRGLESDFDPDKMHPGEWAVSLDTKYVRMCFAPGVCIRMATYDAFEADVAKIQGILEEVQTIEEAVTRINTEISEKANAVAEYTEQAKGYRDETKQFRDGAETSATNAKSSEDKAKVSETNAKVSEINAKISEENAQRVAESLPEDYTELSKAFYNTAIKQKAVGDNIHVTDSAEARNVAFGLYGKAEQNGEPTPDNTIEIVVSGSDGSVEVVSCGKNLLENTAESKTSNGVTFTVNEDGSALVNGTATEQTTLVLSSYKVLSKGKYKFAYDYSSNNVLTSIDQMSSEGKWEMGIGKNGVEFEITEELASSKKFTFYIRVAEGKTVNNVTVYPMLRRTEDSEEYEPYTETVSTIPTPDGLCGIKVSSGGNYTDENGQQWICDEIVKYADGSGKRIQRIGKYVFNGTESWYKNGESETEYRYYLNKTKIGIDTVNNNGMCTHFQIANTTSQTTILIYSPSIPTSLYIGAQDILTTENTVESFKEWLSNNNVSILYILATPIITDLTAEEIAEIEKLHTFYPVTNISNDADCGMAVTYMADAKNYIDNRLALLETALVNSI